jgi:hypothetical protein
LYKRSNHSIKRVRKFTLPERLAACKWYKYSRSKLAGVEHMGYNTRPPRPKTVKGYGENDA